ncbi:hypothetical protein N182_21290 [Sinorhizobium sp. GL2]|nr:hypothetical protein N182_21290 [Sinorhizobium sp. GL2]
MQPVEHGDDLSLQIQTKLLKIMDSLLSSGRLSLKSIECLCRQRILFEEVVQSMIFDRSQSFAMTGQRHCQARASKMHQTHIASRLLVCGSTNTRYFNPLRMSLGELRLSRMPLCEPERALQEASLVGVAETELVDQESCQLIASIRKFGNSC